MSEKEPKNYQVPNVERSLRIMEFLKNHSEGMGVSDVAKALGFPNNSVFRIMNTLHQNGYLERNETTKKFRLSLKLFSMSYGSIAEKNLMECAMPVMRELANKIGETVVLSIINKDGGIVIEQAPGIHPFRFICDPGTHQPLHSSASTKAILAYLPEEEKKNILKRIKFKKYTKNTLTSLRDFKKELTAVKKVGYALDLAEAMDGVFCAAAPIFNNYEHPVAAITTTGPSNRLPKEELPEIGQTVREYANRVSIQMGYKLT